jgi:hypothetical protein
LPITLIKPRLQHTFGVGVAYKVIGKPLSLPDAKTLAEQDPYQFPRKIFDMEKLLSIQVKNTQTEAVAFFNNFPYTGGLHR